MLDTLIGQGQEASVVRRTWTLGTPIKRNTKAITVTPLILSGVETDSMSGYPDVEYGLFLTPIIRLYVRKTQYELSRTYLDNFPQIDR